MSLEDIRKEYTLQGMWEHDLLPDPIQQFEAWLATAIESKLPEPTAMTLATVGSDRRPSARMVLLKHVDHQGFTFFTNYTSRKGSEIEASPWVSLIFFWVALERQVRVEGQAHRIAEADSDAYFQTRPRGSQLSTWASHQSEIIPDRALLERRMQELEDRYADQPIPRPPYWGGLRVEPAAIEFWQGRQNRMHDRLRYRLDESSAWVLERLSP